MKESFRCAKAQPVRESMVMLPFAYNNGRWLDVWCCLAIECPRVSVGVNIVRDHGPWKPSRY